MFYFFIGVPLIGLVTVIGGIVTFTIGVYKDKKEAKNKKEITENGNSLTQN